MKVIIIRPSSVKNNLPAIISNAPDNSIIRIMAGTYKFDKPIIIKNKHNITIYGIGKVNLLCTEMDAKIFQIVNCNNIKLINLYVSHKKWYRYCFPGEDVVYLKNSRNITIDKCSLNGTGFIGVHAIKSSNLLIKNSRLFYNTFLGTYLKSCKRVFIKNNYLYTNELGGIKIDNSNLIKIISNRINNNYKYSNSVYEPYYIEREKRKYFGVLIKNSKNIYLSRNYIFNQNRGVHIEKSQSVMFFHNKIFDNSKEPVYINKSKNTYFENNEIETMTKIKRVNSIIKTKNNRNKIVFGHKVFPFEKNAGIITGRSVNVRSAPSLRSRRIASVKEHDKVYIIRRVGRKVKIGSFKAWWFKIKTVKGRTGYIFGAFLFSVKKILKKYSHDYDRYHYMELILKQNYTYIVKIYHRKKRKVINVRKGKFNIMGRRLTFNPGFRFYIFGKRLLKYVYLHTETIDFKRIRYPGPESTYPKPKHCLSFSLLPVFMRFQYGFRD